MKSIPLSYVFLTFAVFLLLTSFSCESTKSTTASETAVLIDQISISYSGMSGFEQHQISQNQMITSLKGRGDATGDKKKDISQSDWNRLNELVSQLDLSKFEKWESPTLERFHDAARATIITIESNGQSYTSQAFDEGMPPAEINDLYQYLANMTRS